ncbi:Glycogen synthase [Stieleria varia]|uniref:Glycogen synthase n=2 Tax=Stieleria varia TaxID=2528005 RepID=A0A5C6AMD0_9BACT|nr:Glycogen synthase [Stieleria varia]
MISSLRGGGSERQVLMLLRTLDRERFEPLLYLTERAGEFLSDVPADVPILSHQDCPHASGIYVPGRALRRQCDFLGALLGQHGIDMIYDRTFHMTMIAGPAAATRAIPRVSTIVSPPHLALPLVERRFVWLKRRRLAKAYRNADRVIAVSDQAAQSASEYYRLARSSITVVPNPVDLRSLQRNARPLRRDDYVRLVCVGRMTREKGHADLIAAVGESRKKGGARFTLDLIGDGPLRTELQMQVDSLDLGDTVRFLGHLPDASREIAESDALVLPSHFEGMPNVVLEAMAIGTPVIATRAGGTVELQRDEPTVFWAEPRDVHSLCQALQRFLAEPETATRHVAAAQRMVAEHHDLQKTTRELESVFEQVIG